MAIGYVGKTTTNEPASTDTLTVDVGTPTEDNYLLMLVTYRSDRTVSTPPSGWTLVSHLADANAGSSVMGTYYYKVAGASESDPDVVLSSASTEFAALVFEFSGVDTTTPIDVAVSTSANSFGSSKTSPDITTITDGAWWISGVVHDDSADAPWTGNATGVTSIHAGNVGGADVGAATEYKEIATAAATGTNVWSTGGGSEQSQAFSLALRPGAGGASSTDVNLHGTGRGILRGVGRGVG